MLFPVPLQIGCEWFLWSEKPAQASMAVGGFAHVPGSRLVQLGWLGWDGGLSSAEAHVVGEVILATGRAGPTRQVLHALCLYHSCCYPVGQSKRMNESRVKTIRIRCNNHQWLTSIKKKKKERIRNKSGVKLIALWK